MVYLISYDLNKTGQDYKVLYDTIKNLGNNIWMHPLDSTWLIKSNLTAKQIYDKLKPIIDDNDLLFISEITKNYSGWLQTDLWDYLKNMF